MAGRANRQVIDPWTWIGAGLRKHVQFKRLVEQVFPLEWHNKTGGFDVTTWHAMSVISTKNGWHFWNTFLLLKVDLNLRDFTWNSGQRINNLIKSVMLILFNSVHPVDWWNPLPWFETKWRCWIETALPAVTGCFSEHSESLFYRLIVQLLHPPSPPSPPSPYGNNGFLM